MIDYLKKHHAITEQAIGSVHVLLKRGKHKEALKEVEIAIAELDKAEDHEKQLGTRAMIKKVESTNGWKKEGGLYRHWKYGVRNLKEAFHIILAT